VELGSFVLVDEKRFREFQYWVFFAGAIAPFLVASGGILMED
jgi:hypothetical protein